LGDHTAIEAVPGAIARMPDTDREVARTVVMAARHHQRERRSHALGAIVRSVGSDARIGEVASGLCKPRAIHADRALPRISVHDRVDRRADIVVMHHEMKHRAVEVAALVQYLRVEHYRRLRRSIFDPALNEIEHGIPGTISKLLDQHVDDDQRAGVDERVAWNALGSLKIDHRIERIARGLAPHPFEHRIAKFLQCQAEREDLRDALDREGFG
jgi:hypothetical protein